MANGGPPACASVLVKPDTAPQNAPAAGPGGWPCAAVSRRAMRSVKRNHWLSANVIAMIADQQPDRIRRQEAEREAAERDARPARRAA